MKCMRMLLIAILLCFLPLTIAARENPIGAGESFPDLVLQKPLGPDAGIYLGIPDHVSFSLSHVEADLVLVELLSVYCPHCQQQVKHFNRLRELIEKNPATRGRIKLLGIAVASKGAEVERFISRFQVAYPVVPDPDFQLYHALGAGVTPFSVFVRRTSYGQAGVVAGTHIGLQKMPHQLLAELSSLADLFPDELRARVPGQGAVPKGIAEVVSADELETRLMRAFTRFGGGAISAFQPLELASGRRVYLADTLGGKKQRRLFAEVVARRNICDICHDVHFFYLFDSFGKVLAFEPLQLSKMGNKPWSREDVRKM
ncbi:MAG: TlpA family protein disulfide reductase, partial [Deltaproteobacteria bacterium]|nr:TlpA family protein disulfide reductase [Deltaproteobacteria bacterium]